MWAQVMQLISGMRRKSKCVLSRLKRRCSPSPCHNVTVEVGTAAWAQFLQVPLEPRAASQKLGMIGSQQDVQHGIGVEEWEGGSKYHGQQGALVPLRC